MRFVLIISLQKPKSIKIFNKNTLKEQISCIKHLIMINNLGSSKDLVITRFIFFKMVSLGGLAGRWPSGEKHRNGLSEIWHPDTGIQQHEEEEGSGSLGPPRIPASKN